MSRSENLQKEFTFINESFLCKNCGLNIPPLTMGCRNHCPSCLYSLHLDIWPGDRQSTCGGLMKPVSYRVKSYKEIVLTHRCLQCGAIKNNKASHEDSGVADSLDAILSLSKLV